MGVPELIEHGIRAYLAGRERDALAVFEEVLAVDPDNRKARWYIEKLRETGVTAPPSGARPPPASPASPPPAAGASPPAPAEHDIEIALTPVPMADRALELQPVRTVAPAGPIPPAAPPPAAAAPLAPFAGAVPWPAPPVAPAAAGSLPAPDSDDARAAAHAVIAAALGLGEAGERAAPAPTPAPVAAGVPGGHPLDASRLPPLEEEYAPSPWDDGPAARATIVLEAAGGLDLGAVEDKSDLRPLVPEGARPSPAPRNDVEVWLAAAKELFALGDFSGSLELIEKILQVDPDHGEARDYLRQNEATLISMYESKLGPLTRVPRLAIKPEEILWLNLDHRAGFLLAQIDGVVDYDSLFALSGLPRLDTARILANLIADGVIRS